MRPRALPLAHLPDLVSPLFASRSAVVLTCATADLPWAARATWAFVRAAAAGGRKVTLVDLSLEQPALDAGAAQPPVDGIVDAFVYGASLSHVAREQDIPGLHYIGAGTYPTDPVEIWSSPRWRRLSRGYAAERALLVLFVPPAALPVLGFEPDGLVVLAPVGFDPADGGFPRISDRVAAGTPLLAVIVDRVQPAPPAPPPPARITPHPSFRRSARSMESGRPRWIPLVVVAGTLIAGAVALINGRAGLRPSGDGPRSGGQPSTAVGASASRPDEPAGDSLYYSVQVAAFNTLARAMAHAADLEGARWATAVSPVQVGNQSLWYRVLVGALPTPRAADSVLQALWRSGVVERPQGTIVRTRLAYVLGNRVADREGRDLVTGLRARGVPAYIVEAPGGAVRLYLGALEGPDQAPMLDSLVGAAGLPAFLVSRMGISR